MLVVRAPSARGGSCRLYACWEWGCLRVLRAWGRLGLLRLPPYGSRYLHDRTLTHPPTVLPASQPAGLPHTPPQVSGVGVPQGALEGGAFSAALRDSLDAFISPLHERLSFLETALGASRRSRRRRRRSSSSSSDGEYSGGDGGRHVPGRAVARALGREPEGDPHRRLPEKIIPADDRYAVILDCAAYALANGTDVRYDRTMAHGLGRLRKDVSATFGRDAEWDGTPALGVFKFLNRFVKAGNDNDVSEGRALYLLPEFTKGDLKRELYSIMPSLQGGRSGEVSSYMELVNWLLRKYVDEQSLSVGLMTLVR